MPDPESILIIRLSSLGDVLMSMPAVVAIRRRFPEAHLSWLVEGSVGALLTGQTFVDEVIRFPRSAVTKALKRANPKDLKGAFLPFARQLRKRKYDLIVDFHGIAKSVLLSMIAGRGERIGFGSMFAKEQSHFFYDTKITGDDKRIHKVERNMLIARHLGFDGPAPEVPLISFAAAEGYIGSFLSSVGGPSPFFAVNPFSSAGTDFKRWPLEYYGELIAGIHNRLGVRTVIIWGPGEKEDALRLQKMASEGAFLACPTDIPQLFALLQRTSLYVGGDTGVMHLAAAAKTPVVAIFGPTDVKVNGPWGEGQTIITREVPCSPCKKKDCSQRGCIVTISVDEVYNTVASVFSKRNTTK